MQEKETIYFLQWLSKESGFTENQILENMKPENHGWDDRINYSSLRDFKNKEFKKIQWLENLFLWEKSILNNDFVICDRFFDSTLIYQGYALGLSGLAAKGVRLFGFGIKPDLTFFLDVPPKKALARITNKDRIESRPIKFHRKLREGYINLCKKYPRRIKLINAGGNLEKIFREIEYFLEDFFKKHHYD